MDLHLNNISRGLPRTIPVSAVERLTLGFLADDSLLGGE
jgi:hypothetical protein